MASEVGLGERLRQLREAADISLRELSKEAGISPPFLSDIELGRRYPSDEILAKLAKTLKVSVDELKHLDTRGAAQDVKKLIEANPSLGFAFRTLVDRVKDGKFSPSEVAAQLNKLYDPKKK
jgi:transcriptional regulator with XRE-family HTH domain